jgi:hypothetical protein
MIPDMKPLNTSNFNKLFISLIDNFVEIEAANEDNKNNNAFPKVSILISG